MANKTGILAWYDCRISTGKVEGINNKMKVMKRTAYGFRDEHYSDSDFMLYMIAASLEMSDEPNFFQFTPKH